MPATHRLELAVTSGPAVLDRVISTCRARRCEVVALEFAAAGVDGTGRIALTVDGAEPAVHVRRSSAPQDTLRPVYTAPRMAPGAEEVDAQLDVLHRSDDAVGHHPPAASGGEAATQLGLEALQRATELLINSLFQGLPADQGQASAADRAGLRLPRRLGRDS